MSAEKDPAAAAATLRAAAEALADANFYFDPNGVKEDLVEWLHCRADSIERGQ